MDLTARDIHEKQFHDSWRGYNQEEVDEFLDRLADVLDRLQRENSALHARITELDHAVATSRDTEEMLKKTLVTAQQAAEEAIASAKAKAEALIQEAEERTRKVHREADEKLQQADAEARRKGLEADREHTIRKREIDSSLEKLRRFESDLKRRLASFLNEQQRGLDRLTEEEPPRYQPPRSLEPGSQSVATEAVPAAAEREMTDPPIARSEVMEDEDDEGSTDVDLQATGQWIPDFMASNGREGEDEGNPQILAAEQNGSGSGSWEEPGFVHETENESLYEAAQVPDVEEDAEAEADDDDADAQGPALEESPSDEEGDTVTLAEEEAAPARSRSSRLFWRGDS